MRIDTYYEFITQVERPLFRLETGDYLFSFSGKLVCCIEHTEETNEFDDEKRIDVAALSRDPIIGHIHGYVIQAQRALEEGVDLLEECDSYDQAVCDFADAFYHPETGKFRKNIASQFSPNRLDLLGVESIMVHPQHRGQELGLRILERIVEQYGGGCGLLAINITPPQAYVDSEQKLSALEAHAETDPEIAGTKLIEYFSSLGLKGVAGTPYVALSLKEGILSAEKEMEKEVLEAVVWN